MFEPEHGGARSVGERETRTQPARARPSTLSPDRGRPSIHHRRQMNINRAMETEIFCFYTLPPSSKTASQFTCARSSTARYVTDRRRRRRRHQPLDSDIRLEFVDGFDRLKDGQHSPHSSPKHTYRSLRWPLLLPD
uniref:Uncharacterized protein n=1 Tax=Anopheles melas TaxID=34690 RepID=A0A182U893_9DIPT